MNHKPTAFLLLNTLIYVKELCLNNQPSDVLLSKIVEEVEKTRAAFDTAMSGPPAFDSYNGNWVELRKVGMASWLFVNGVHIAGVKRTALNHASDCITTFTVEFEPGALIGFDTHSKGSQE